MDDQTTTATPPPQQTQAIGDDGEAGWAAAAQPAAGPNPAQAALTAAQNPDPTKAPQTESPKVNADMGAPPMPLALRPVRRGLLGIVDKMADVLTGETKPEIYEDGQGDKYVMHPNMGHGEQWMRIGAGLLEGAAKGYAAGQGAGGAGRAGVAGIDAGKQLRTDQHNQETQMTDEARTEMLDKANAQMMRMKLAEQTWKMSRLQIDADQNDADRAAAHAKDLEALGGQNVGHMATPADISKILKTTPDISKHMVQNSTVNPVPHFDIDENGKVKRNGFDVYLMKDAWRKEILPAGASFDWYNPQTHEIEKQNSSSPMSAGDQADRHAMASNARDAFLLQQHKTTQEDATAANLTSEKNARDQELPSKIAEHQATAAKARQEGLKAAAETRNLNNGLTADGKSRASTVGVDPLNPADRELIVGGLLDGTLDVKGTFAGRNASQARPQYEAYAKQKDPTWTMAKYDAMHKTQMEYASNEKNAPGGQITSFNYMVGHAGDFMSQIDRLRNSNSPLMNKPLNWLAKNAAGNADVADVYIPMDNLRTEFQKFIEGSALTESDKADKNKKLNEDLTPAQMEGVAREMIGTGAIRLGGLNQGFKRTMGRDYPGLLDDQSRGILQKAANGTDPSSKLLKATLDYHIPTWNGVKMQAPDGSTQLVPQSQVEFYKSKGAKVTQ